MLSCFKRTRGIGRFINAVTLCGVLSTTFVAPCAFAEDENERFKDVEVRVIRPRYFNKRKRLELGGQLVGVMNEAFIYTFMVSGILAYHFTETFAFELQAGVGTSFDKEDKRILFDEFDIKTKLFRALYSIEGAIQFTPIYGKWQLPTGRLVYFDTYISAGGGLTGIDWKYSEMCQQPDKVKNPGADDIKSNAVKSYPTVAIGLGQRYFLNKDLAVRWDIRNHTMIYNKFDAECSVNPASAESGSAPHNIITLQVGASKFL